jgi:ferredoxin-NADP reductase/ferredoxin
MIQVVYEGLVLTLEEGENLLDGLLERGFSVPHGCRTGSCQSCLLKCTAGDIPKDAQKGLKDSQILNHQLLACQCFPEGPMQLSLPASDQQKHQAKVTHLRRLNPRIMEVGLDVEPPLDYRAGQFIHLYRPDGTGRCYSLASVPTLDSALLLHVQAYPNGALSQWIHQELAVGDEVSISDAAGDCLYIPGNPDQPLLLIGTGSGLAPLYGILRDALEQGHEGPIHLFHGSRSEGGLYLEDELNVLMALHPQFHYQACVSGTPVDLRPPLLHGRAADLALATHTDLRGWRVYLCGHPEMVQNTQFQVFLAGAAPKEIHVDAFDSQAPKS